MKLKTSLTGIALMAIFTLGAPQVHAQTYDPATDFSIATNTNVNSVWSYGQYLTLGGGFSLLSTPVTPDNVNPVLESWQGTVPGFLENYPLILHNPTGTSQSFFTATSEADELILHPGPNGEYSVLRFVVPTTGSYNLNGIFTGRDSATTTTDVSVFLNLGVGSPLFAGDINVTGGNTASFNVTQSFTAGDTVDFAVGYGNGSYTNDSTGLKLAVTPVTSAPEPATIALLAMGSGCGILARRRKRREA
jgi:hypothetical protein